MRSLGLLLASLWVASISAACFTGTGTSASTATAVVPWLVVSAQETTDGDAVMLRLDYIDSGGRSQRWERIDKRNYPSYRQCWATARLGAELPACARSEEGHTPTPTPIPRPSITPTALP